MPQKYTIHKGKPIEVNPHTEKTGKNRIVGNLICPMSRVTPSLDFYIFRTDFILEERAAGADFVWPTADAEFQI